MKVYTNRREIVVLPLTLDRAVGNAAAGAAISDGGTVTINLPATLSLSAGELTATLQILDRAGSQQFEPVARFDAAQNRFVAVPIDLGPATDQVFLILFCTGIRNRTSLPAVAGRVGKIDARALFAGAAPGFVGFDQVNLSLPRSLAGRGEVDVALSVDNRAANTVRISVR
jgi:uncharacterized protein (TIGR03437 family)